MRQTVPASDIGRANHVERKSGYLVAFSICGRQDNEFNKATIPAFSVIPDKLKKCFAVDNGKGFAAYQQIAEATRMKVYFCEPYSLMLYNKT